MSFTYPHTIENGAGEQLTFVALHQDGETDYLEVENRIQPGSGPPMHVHFRQDESLTVIQGRMGVQMPGQEPKFYGEGDSAEFEAGMPHRFWNAGEELLICRGWIRPAHNIEYFLTEIYRSTAANGGTRPSPFDAAWLMHKYRSEFDMMEIPRFVRRVLFPILRRIGQWQGRHRKYAGSPEAVQ